MRHLTALVFGLATVAVAAPPTRADEVVVFAAASLKSALDRAATEFTAATGHQVTLSYAGSNQLAKQIQAGAGADVFLSASEAWMDAIEQDGLIAAGKRQDLFGNELVLIAAEGAGALDLAQPETVLAALGRGPLAMGMVDAVPAGQYGKAALQSLGIWQAVEPLVAQTDNVRAALTLVERGEAPFGIVYRSDVKAAQVAVVASFPPDSHPPILYPAALLSAAQDAGDLAFYEWLFTEPAASIFLSEGFTLAG